MTLGHLAIVLFLFTVYPPHSYIGCENNTFRIWHSVDYWSETARPNKFYVNVMGDGAFGMSGTDIETAARSKVPTTTPLITIIWQLTPAPIGELLERKQEPNMEYQICMAIMLK